MRYELTRYDGMIHAFVALPAVLPLVYFMMKRLSK